MSLYSMRDTFDKIMRTLGEDDFESFRDGWLNDAWDRIALMFVVPSLTKTITFASVADQQKYHFPYDYNGTEVSLKYDNERLDPSPQSVLELAYDNRQGNKGAVEYYDWSGTQGPDPLASVSDCILVNGSKTVLCPDAAAIHDEEWVRFDPVSNGAGGYTDPGDYGYQIKAVTVGVSYTLDRDYRGPSCTTTGQVRPAETQAIIVFGIPATTGVEFELKYSAKPQRLYNPTDVPEWPSVSMAVVMMAVSIGSDFYHQPNLGKVWWGRAMSRVKNLQARKETSRAELVHDLTIGSVSGRRTGLRGVWTGSNRLRTR